MPIRDREARLRHQRDYNARQTPGYHAWLYARRKLRFDNAEVFRLVLEEALLLDDPEAVKVLIREALDGADQAEAEVGNRYDHERDRPYYQTEGMMLGGAEGN